MSLKYALIENLLTQNKTDDYTARPVDVVSHDFDSIVNQMLEKGSTVTRTDILAVLNNFFEVCASITQDGESINTDLFKSHFSIGGIFQGAGDKFDPKKHELKLNLQLGKTLKDPLSKVHLEKTTVGENLPNILEVRDVSSDSINDQITSQGVVEVTGSRLKVEGNNIMNGVVFISSDGVKVKRVTTMVENKPSRLIFVAPTLDPGTYTLRVTTQFSTGGNIILKQPRTGVFSKTLTVS